MDNKVVYICKYKVVGIPFAVYDKQKAEDWVSFDPEIRYYEVVEFMQNLEVAS